MVVHSPALFASTEKIGSGEIILSQAGEKQSPQWFPVSLDDDVPDPKLLMEVTLTITKIFPLEDLTAFADVSFFTFRKTS